MSPTGIYRAFWALFLGAMMVLGMMRLGWSKAPLALTDRGPNSSANSILHQTLGEPRLASRIAEFMEGLPQGRPILILAAPNNTSAALTADVLSYLAWPRPAVVSTDREQWPELLLQHYDALAFCDVDPPPGAKTHSFGRALTFILFETAAE